MGTYVLVHGAWQGAWYWEPVAAILRAEGHVVFAPTLTGLGERSHHLSPDVNLETHIQDVLGVYKYQRIEKSTLVGHSYGGAVVTGVADRLYDKIDNLIYFDAFLPQNGQSVMDIQLPERRAQIRSSADEGGDGWKLPWRPAASWGIEQDFCDLFDELAGFHPMACLEERQALQDNRSEIQKKVYLEATGTRSGPFGVFAKWARDQQDWTVRDFDGHHYVMMTDPAQAARLLLDVS